MTAQIRPAIVSLVSLTLLSGVAYPLLVTAIAQGVFPEKASGSLVIRDGKPIGSALIGQSFSDPKYFWGRPSATAPVPYNASASGGSNLGATNPALLGAIKERVAALQAADPENSLPVPVDLVTASGSGLDPEISPAAAEYQAARVAKARNREVDEIRQLVAAHMRDRTMGVLGERRVNVLQLNLALDAMEPADAASNAGQPQEQPQ